jgi:hypothetical protein
MIATYIMMSNCFKNFNFSQDLPCLSINPEAIGQVAYTTMI